MTSVALAAGAWAPALAQTLPTGPSVAAGAVSIATPSGTSVIINQTSRNAVVNWNSFSIGAGNSVAINNGSGATLNRVTGNIPSRIDGSLTATGSVYLVNPAGVAVGPGGKVTTGGSFTASTLDIPDAAFLKDGDKNFSGTSKATVTNAGSIGALGGDVALIAREVSNTGTLSAPNGTVGLAAGYEVLVKDGAVEGGKFQVKVGGADTAARTSGRIAAAAAEIRANGGNVYALAGNTGGVVAATGTAEKGGRIYLTAGDTGTVEAGGTVTATRTGENGTVQGGDIRVSGGAATVTGTLSAKGTGAKGGTVAVAGSSVTVTGTATVDASGSRGGAIAVGGDYQGGKAAARKTLKDAVANAKTTTIAAGARLSADGAAGDGGSVVVWSDEHTDFAGTITARGAGAGGKGGDAEVSGKATLSFRGTADLTAAAGPFGTLLLDPYNLTISAESDSTVSNASNVFTAGGNDSVLSVATLTNALALAHIAVSTGATGSSGSQAGTITVAAPVTWSSSSSLTLSATGDIVINAPITATGDGAWLTLQYGVGRGYTIANNVSVTMSGSGPHLRIGTTGALQTYQTISSMADLASIDSAGATGYYALVKNLDAAGTTYTGSLVSQSFSGTFAGLGNTISNLTVRAPETDNVGLFATIGSGGIVRDFTLTGATLSGKGFVGGLAGSNAGTITQTHVTGSVTGTGGNIGGLAGSNAGTIGQSYATAAVTGSGGNVGGLAGTNTGTITQSYVTGSVTGGGGSTGGFVGLNDLSGSITDSYTTASVTQGNSVAGFVGMNDGSATIARSYATGLISGRGRFYTGGFIGIVAGGTASYSYWDKGTTGQDSSDGPVTGLTTTSAFSSASYTGFDFTNTWYMVDGQTRPFLRSEYSTVIGNAHQLQLMGMDPSAAYTLATDIDARDTGASSAAGMWRISGNQSGFAPVGDSQNPFTGSLDGGGHVIRGLTFASTDGGAKLGLFGVVDTAGSIRDIGLTDVTITGTGAQAGSLVSENSGTIVNAYATGTVTGGTGVGGLVGRNTGSITQSHAAVAVTGDANVGGLIGNSQNGTVSEAYATGTVNGAMAVGGLIGISHDGTVSKAYATGTVNGATAVGGLIGTLWGEQVLLSESYATGAVTATNNRAGGLVGEMAEEANANNVYATGSVTGAINAGNGDHYIGGLVGEFKYGTGAMIFGTISNAYATGRVTLASTCTAGNCKAGGLAGRSAVGSFSVGYWDKGTTGQAIGIGNGSSNNVTGIETADAFSAATYGDLDLTNKWYMIDGQTRPFLRSEHAASIVNAHQLQLMALDPTAAYTLAANVDAGETAGSNAAGMWRGSGRKYGFLPVGSSSTPFTGSLDGQGHVIQGLTIKPVDYEEMYQGLFGVIGAAGSVRNLGLTDVALIGAGNYAGGLAGENGGTITNVYITGSVQGSYAGGLVGKNTGTISRSYSTVTVSQSVVDGAVVGSDVMGGLVGENTGTITQSYVTGDVIGRSTAGGFVAKNSGTITQSYATGAVTARNGTDTGGFVAENTGSISQSYATGGAVYGDNSVGGFVASNKGDISQSYAAKAVSGPQWVGGFFGFQLSGTITSSYFDTTVAGTTVPAGAPPTVTGVTGLTTAEFQNTASFMAGASDWDFDNVWVPPSSGYYPVLYAMAPVTRVTALSADTVYGSGSGTVTAIGTQSSLSRYVFGKAGDSLALTGATITTDPTAAVSATPTTASQPAFNATVTSAKGTDYRVLYYGSAALTVTPAALTVTADAATKTYGDAATLSGYTVTGLKNSDSVTGVTLASTGAAATAGVGSYSISGSGATGTGLSNYTVSYTDGTLTVNPASLTVTADAATKTYGDTATLSGYTVTGLKNSDSVTGVTLVGSGGTAATDGVGSYTITASSALGTGLSNYTVSYTDGTLTVNPASLTVTADNVTKTYGDTATLTGYTVTGLKNSDSVTGVTLASTGSGATAGVGSYSISGSSAQGTGLSNYTVSYTDGTLTVNPAALTVTADNATKTYGDTASLSGYTVTGLKNSDSVTGVTLASTGAAATAGVASYSISGSRAQGTGLSNYTVSYTDGTLTVNPAALTVTADNVTKTYGDTASLTGYTVTGLKNSDGVTGVTLSGSGGAAATDGVGSYTITASSAQGTGLSNYTVSYTDGTLTVNPAALTVTADNATKTYGDTASLSGYTATGLKNSDSVTGVTLSSSGGAAATDGVGNYIITASSAQGTGLSNYTVSYTDGTLTVNPAALTVTADNATKTYGDAASLSGYTVTGLKNSDSVTGVTLASTGAAATAGVASYSISGSRAQGTGLSNYTVSYTDGTLTVTPAALAIIAGNAAKTYGDAASLSGYTVTGLKNSDSVTSLVLSSTGAAATAGIGNYSISGSRAQGTGLSNYTVSYTDGTLTVTPAALTITAGNAAKTYGDAASLSGYTATGLKNSDSVTGVTLASTGAEATAGIGNYSISGSRAQGTGLSNYTVSYTDGMLTVTPAALTITAGNAAKTYGDTASLTGYTATGLKNSDSVTGVTLASTGAVATAGVGSYSISGSSAQGMGLSNYTVSYTDGTLTVNPAALTITAGNAVKTYGDTASLSGYTVTGLTNGDSVSSLALSSTGAAATAGRGGYALVAGNAQGAGLSNYVIRYADGTLTVNARPIVVTADALSRLAGTANPALTYSVGGQGLVNGDTLTGALTTAATAAAPAGTYAITQGTLAASSNYGLSFTPGVLTVTPAGESGGAVAPARMAEVAEVLTSVVLPRNLVVVTASEVTTPVQSRDTLAPVAPSSSPAAFSGASANAATGTTDAPAGDSGPVGTAGTAAACTGGAATNGACTTTPHPENTRVGQFLRFSMR